MSEKQVAALVKLASRYSGSIPGFPEIAAELGGSVPEAAPAPALPGAPSDADLLLDAMSRITAWAEPVKRGRRMYDDKDFYQSIVKQKKSGKVLSIKQVEALRKLAAKYGIQV